MSWTPECSRNRHSYPGCRIELGTCIGYAIEPGVMAGRLVAIFHHPEREIQRYLIQCPDGTYFTTSLHGLVPHIP